MRSILKRLMSLILFTVVSCSIGAVLSHRALSDESTPPAPCAAPVYHQFDFWIGDWDVFSAAGQPRSHMAELIPYSVGRHQGRHTW